MAHDVDISAYLDRIDYDGPTGPSLETLMALQTRHLDSIPFEAIDVALDRGVDLTPQAVDAKLIGARRGGYCYEQNGLFLRVLRRLGFEADGLLCRVRMGRKPGDAPMARTHMALRVTLDGALWLVDVGFGGMVPPAPLKIEEKSVQETAHEPWRITAQDGFRLSEAMVGDLWEPMYEIYDDPQAEVDYEPANWFVSTHPSSFFRRDLVAARVAPDARYALFGARLTIRRRGRPMERRELSVSELEATLRDVFGLEPKTDWRPLLERTAAGIAA